MRILTSLFMAVAAVTSNPTPPPAERSCVDDYLTIESIRGTIIEIKPAPEPFHSADIYLTGPPPCDRMWMQVLKRDAARCRAGGRIEVKGIVTADVENNSWEIGPARNAYMTLGDDFTCE